MSDLPDNELVICPACTHQFRAIPVNVQQELQAVKDANTQLALANGTLKDQLDAWTNRFAQETHELAKHRDELLANAQLHESRMAAALNDHFKMRSEHHDLLVRHAQLVRDHSSLRQSLTNVLRVQPARPSAVHQDEYGPLYKDDLDADELRDGRLVRSASSRHMARAQAAKARADVNFGGQHSVASQLGQPAPIVNPPQELFGEIEKPMDVNNIVGGPNEPALAQERQADRDSAERRAADAMNAAFEEPPYNGKVSKPDPRIIRTVGDYARERFEASHPRPNKSSTEDSCLADVAFPEVLREPSDANIGNGPYPDNLYEPGPVYKSAMDALRSTASDETSNHPDKPSEGR